MGSTSSRGEDTSEQYRDYRGCRLLDSYAPIADAIENFRVRDDDVWVCSFPRSGTTWTQEMVWSIVTGSSSDVPLQYRFPYLELPGTSSIWTEFNELAKLCPRGIAARLYIRRIANLPSPRFIKTHLPFQLQLRERRTRCKLVYVSRDVKDASVSSYHFYKMYAGWCGSYEDYCSLFLEDKIIYTPYWGNVNGYLRRVDDNILCIRFEDMKSDLRSIIRRVATFLGKTLTDEQTKNLESRLSFAQMRKNPAVNYESVVAKMAAKKLHGEDFVYEGRFMRSGEVGQWKKMMSEELVKRFDDWIEENSGKL